MVWVTRKTLSALVLALVLIIALSLSLVAVLRVRQEFDRVKCENNLRQVAIGLHNHIDTYGVLPLAVTPVLPPGEKYSIRIPPGGPLKGLPVERRFSWQVETLPFLMSQRIFDRLDFTKAWDDPENVERLAWQETIAWDERTNSKHMGPG